MRWLLVLVAVTPAFAQSPGSAKAAAKEVARLRGECDHGTAASCSQLGSLYASDYTDLATGYHHAPDLAAGRKAHTKAIELLEPACANDDGQACNAIAQIYQGEALHDRAKRNTYLERACSAKHAWSCFDRGQSNGRSKSSTVPWYARACTLGEKDGCKGLGMMVLAAFVLDPVDHTPMDPTELRAALTTAATDATPQHQPQLALASAVAHVWAGERKEALAELKPSDDEHMKVFTAFVELAAADGVDKPRVQAAWKRLTVLAKKKDNGSYDRLELESDYAWADPTAAMTRAAAIAAHNQ